MIFVAEVGYIASKPRMSRKTSHLFKFLQTLESGQSLRVFFFGELESWTEFESYF